jgi:hypothetical protein
MMKTSDILVVALESCPKEPESSIINNVDCHESIRSKSMILAIEYADIQQIPCSPYMIIDNIPHEQNRMIPPFQTEKAKQKATLS